VGKATIDDITARRLAASRARTEASADELRERVVDAMIDFASAVRPHLKGKARLDFTVSALRSMANGLEKAGAALLREEGGGG
jgi:hypothetical protein